MSERLKALAKSLIGHVKARVMVVGVQSYDEFGVRRAVEAAAGACSASPAERMKVGYWSAAGGWEPKGAIEGGALMLEEALGQIAEVQSRAILVLFDPMPFLSDPAQNPGSAGAVRRLRELVRDLAGVPASSARLVVLCSKRIALPPDLKDEIPVLSLGLPQSEDHLEFLREACSLRKVQISEPELKVVAKAGLGLSSRAFSNAVATSLVETGSISISAIHQAKKAALDNSAVRWMDVPTDASVGGLENAKEWFARRKLAWTDEARAAGLEMPKGLLVTGIAGTGKSALAIAMANTLGWPLIRLSFADMMGKYLGESEGRQREAFQIIDAIGECVVLADELEKSLSGGGELDGGTSSRMLGEWLTWMQEKRSPAFIVATSNDITKLPPECLRRGRFDELFFVDLPTRVERRAIFELHLAKRGLSVEVTDDLIRRSEGFSGAEIEAAIVSARFAAFAEGCNISLRHLIEEIDATLPLSKTAAEKISTLREKARGTMRPASKPDEEQASSQLRALEL